MLQIPKQEEDAHLHPAAQVGIYLPRQSGKVINSFGTYADATRHVASDSTQALQDITAYLPWLASR